MFNVLFVSFYVNFTHPTHSYEFVYVRKHLHRSNKDSWGIGHCFAMTWIDFLLKLWSQLFELKNRCTGFTRFSVLEGKYLWEVFEMLSLKLVLILLKLIQRQYNFHPKLNYVLSKSKDELLLHNCTIHCKIRTMILSWQLLSTPCSVIKFPIVESHLHRKFNFFSLLNDVFQIFTMYSTWNNLQINAKGFVKLSIMGFSKQVHEWKKMFLGQMCWKSCNFCEGKLETS